MKAFISFYSGEQADAEDLCAHLRKRFGAQIEFFFAADWSSVAPGDEWENKVVGALGSADALIVLMSPDALARPWINFEIGVAWATPRDGVRTRILILCHKGLTPQGLPRPYGSLQAVDLNALNHEQTLKRVAEAIAAALGIDSIVAEEATPDIGDAHELTERPDTFRTTDRAWNLRPGAHIGETATSRFLVGAVNPARREHAEKAGLTPGSALVVRLFLGQTPEGSYVNAMVEGDNASFFETVVRDTVIVDATLRVAGVFQDGDHDMRPLLAIDGFSVPQPSLSSPAPAV